MKTSVTNIMMSMALMGCLIFSASDAMAQGRGRSQGGSTTSRSQTAAVSRSSNSTAPTVSRSATPQVNRNSSSSTVNRSSSSSTVKPQTTRSSSSSNTVAPKVDHSSSSTTTPQVNRNSSNTNRSVASPNTNSQVTRPSTSTSSSSSSRPSSTVGTRGGSNKSGGTSTVTRQSDNPSVNVTTHKSTDYTKSDRTTTTTVGNRKGNGGKPNGGNGNVTPDGKPDGGNHGGNGNHGHGGNGNHGHGDNGNHGHGGNGNHGHGDNGNHGHGGNGHHGYDNKNHFDYTGHHYHNDFHNYYTHHLWSWSRPLPPPARPYRPALFAWYRPVIPVGWYPYAGAPVIDRILGITFGTLFDASLDYLYYNGYEIDGYADHIIYLREVPLLNAMWDDVMLSYDSYDRLVNAQFIYHSVYNDRKRYNRVYRNLCRVYGTPFRNSDGSMSWYGGNSTGWVTLSIHNNLGHYYTTVSIGY